MHDLHFLRDAIEGGDFCLALAIETMPSAAGIVHLYDIDKREFVVACIAGRGTERLLLERYPESDVLLAKAMTRRRAIVIADATTNDDALTPRYEALGGAKSVIVAPVMHGGRFIGAIEIVNPIDGAPFDEAEGNALSYIAEQFAEFVAQRGIVVDAERISQRPSALARR
jgi:GAF domain-containing protein